MEVSGQLHTPGRFTPGTHSVEGWMSPRDGLGVLEQGKISLSHYFNKPNRNMGVTPYVYLFIYCTELLR
jgi:hypothetical protein